MADYVAQNSPPNMSFRVTALYMCLNFIVKPHAHLATQDLLHYDMFAGARNMQRVYCALFATDAACGCLICNVRVFMLACSQVGRA